MSSLQYSNASSIVATDTGSGYRQPRARLGHNRVRSWKWVSFTNPARKVCCIILYCILGEGQLYICLILGTLFNILGEDMLELYLIERLVRAIIILHVGWSKFFSLEKRSR